MNSDFLDLLRSLCVADARFLVVGAYAVSYHAEPRATGDLDIWVEATDENARRVHAALAAFGAPLDQLTVADLADERTVFQMGVPPRRIDILTSITISSCWRSTVRDVASVARSIMDRSTSDASGGEGRW